MIKKYLKISCFTLTVFFVCFFSLKLLSPPQYSKLVEPMPIVGDDPYAHLAIGGIPTEQREEVYRKWLSTGLKISVKGASGSGTIIYYDQTSGYAYVQSCGHLWTGNMTATEAKSKKPTCSVITWYHNYSKLPEPKTYPAEVLYYYNNRGQDCSLLRFKPDWMPNFLPISPIDFYFIPNMRLHSVGCDGGREVAHYDVQYLGHRGEDIITTDNSPRPGRSGGGLLSQDYFVGICWGTTEIQGTGNGLFTPLKVLRSLNEQEGYGWLNEVSESWARKLPIIDRNNPQEQYPPDYIPLPKN